MKNDDSMLGRLISSFKILPGIGEKTAQRMAFYLLEKNRLGGKELSRNLLESMSHIKNCQDCRNFTEDTFCSICTNEKRNSDMLCIVESPTDVVAIENSGSFSGYYFVLMGRLSPIDGVGPNEIGIDSLKRMIDKRRPKEIIIATSPTVEGDATAFYIGEQFKNQSIKVSRIAYGVPMGGELEYVDNTTLGRSIKGRRELE